MRSLSKDRLKRGTKVRVRGFDAQILNSCYPDDKGVPSCYRMTILGRKKGNTFWVTLPPDMFEVINDS